MLKSFNIQAAYLGKPLILRGAEARSPFELQQLVLPDSKQATVVREALEIAAKQAAAVSVITPDVKSPEERVQELRRLIQDAHEGRLSRFEQRDLFLWLTSAGDSLHQTRRNILIEHGMSEGLGSIENYDALRFSINMLSIVGGS